jgi:hypothetical protein
MLPLPIYPSLQTLLELYHHNNVAFSRPISASFLNKKKAKKKEKNYAINTANDYDSKHKDFSNPSTTESLVPGKAAPGVAARPAAHLIPPARAPSSAERSSARPEAAGGSGAVLCRLMARGAVGRVVGGGSSGGSSRASDGDGGKHSSEYDEEFHI